MRCKAYFFIVSVLKMPDSYDELLIVYKKGKPDYAFYAEEMVLFFKQKVGKDKVGYFAETDRGELVAVGAPGSVGTIRDNVGTQWIQTKHTIGTDNTELYYFEKKIKISTK